ncbi:hypothetical protein F5Y05DRAFT_406591 [Hypoxylon sp. FL0543]|nr:hypothetical protein F5Y05DRAFT_406591 [Hypoxylon sp. FL0543]
MSHNGSNSGSDRSGGSSSGWSDSQLSYYSDEGVALVTARIKSFFDPDPRFVWEDTIGAGSNGIVYRLRYAAGTYTRRMAVKIAPMDVDLGEGYKSYIEGGPAPGEVLSLAIEKGWLQRLRGCLHVIQSLDMPADPLAQVPQGVTPHRMLNWLFMEYAENGTVTLLVERHLKMYPGELLPCRLLWRLFMCLIRAAVEMAYHDLITLDGRKVDLTMLPLEILKSIPPGPMIHGDLHWGNMVIGAIMPDIQHPEHAVSPNIKLIDLGTARRYNHRDDKFNRTGSQRNIWEIGEIMCFLMLLKQENMDTVQVTVDGQTFEIWGSSMEQAREELIAAGIDPLLIGIVYCCLSHQDFARPGLIDLAMKVHDQVVNRGPNGVERETDEAIFGRVLSLIFYADTSEGF